MFKILKNLKQSWIIIVFIIALLCVQAMADLNLPDYTSKIVNIGIQQGGIENAAPEVITKDTMDKALITTKEDVFILENYEIISKYYIIIVNTGETCLISLCYGIIGACHSKSTHAFTIIFIKKLHTIGIRSIQFIC